MAELNAGTSLLLDQSKRCADQTLGAIATTRNRARTNIAAGAIALTVGLSVATDSGSDFVIAIGVAAIAVFLGVAGVGLWIDRPRQKNTSPNLEEFREHVAEGRYDEDELEKWLANAYLDRVDPPNQKLMGSLASLLEWQFRALALETVLLATALVTSMMR